MNPSRIGRQPNRLALGVWVLLSVLAAAPGRAADAPGADGDAGYDPFRGLDAPQAEGGGSIAAPVYQDRILTESQLEPLPQDEDEGVAAGAPRSAYVELVASHSRFSGESTDEYGLAFGGFRDYADLGALSLEGVIFNSDRERDGGQGWRGSATAWQRGLQMPGGWAVNNGLGVLNTPLPGLLQDQYRFFLPSVPLLGLSTEWNQPDGVSWQASAGRGGVFNGGLINGFETGDGSVASAGAQWAWAPGWDAALALLATSDRIVPDNQGLPDFQNGETNALVLGHRWSGPQDAVSLILQASDTDIDEATGAWFDGRANRGRWTHRYGGFYLEPELAWGAWPINNDVQGGYYRVDFNRARWSWNAGIDRIHSISGNSFEGWYGSGFLRYQASARLGYGGSLSARESQGSGLDESDSAQALQVFTDVQTRAGQTRAQYDYARSDTAPDNWELTLDHALRMREGARLSLAAGYGELDDGDAGTSPSLTLAAYGGFNLADNVTLDGTARWSRQRDTDESSGLDLSLGLRWQLAPHWSLLANINESRGPRRSPFILDPLTNLPVLGSLPNDRSVYVSLRYDFSAGRAQPVLGGPAGSATGTISGSVFLDENGDGLRSANELPARNLTITLDNRFVVRTDERGRFRFERVAVGEHRVAVVADNLPLPWTFESSRSQRTVAVDVRGEATADFAAQRSR